MPANIVMANESDATSVPSGKYDVRVSGGELCYFDSSLNKYVPVVAGSGGRDDAQVTKLYDSSGNVIAEINGSGGMDVGSPAASAGADGLAVGGDVSVEGDMFADGDAVGLSGRFINLGYTPDSHFRSGSLPSGYSWTTSGTAYGGGGFTDPSSAGLSDYDLDYAGDYLYLYNITSGNGQYFLQTSRTRSTGAYVLARLLNGNSFTDSFVGVRFDHGTSSTNFVEWGLKWDGTNRQWYHQCRYNTGGGDTLDTATTPIKTPQFSTVLLFTNSGSLIQQRLVYESGFDLTVLSYGGSMAFSRAGIVFDHTNNFAKSVVDFCKVA
jgi:hypothetical protein